MFFLDEQIVGCERVESFACVGGPRLLQQGEVGVRLEQDLDLVL